MRNFFNSVFIEKTDKVYTQFIRYVFVGGIAFLVDFFVFYFLIQGSFFKRFYIISGTIAFLCGLTTNYFLSIKWVFSRRKLKNRINEFLFFSIVGVTGLLLNLFFLWFFTEIIFLRFIFVERRLALILSKLISTFFVFIWNFTARKILLF